MKSTKYISIGFALLMASCPLFLDAYWTDVINNVGIYAILALSLNVILGHAGLFHMGHAAFYAIGAYTTAILNITYGVPVLWLIVPSGILAGLFALIVARPIIHLRGDYLLIVTIGIVEITRIALINNIFDITGGANGIFGISRPSVFGFKMTKPDHFFYLIWGFAAVTIFFLMRLEHSRFGRALLFIKEDEVAAGGSGINVARHKLVAFVIGAIWAGMCGTIYASKMTIIAPESFSFAESVILFTIVILGGSGSIPGVILGAFLLVGLPELFRGLAEYRMLVFGAAMVLMMIFRNQGLLPPRPKKYTIEDLNPTGGAQ
jgi:branched-chain amino acid transport system permease protein